jgi:hypothetical protein
MQYDRDRSGTVEPHELQAALTSWGMLQMFGFHKKIADFREVLISIV